MGAGKTTIGREVARLTERPFVDVDEEIERRHGPIARLFEERGESEFRRIEEGLTVEALARDDPAVVALGGGALGSERTRHSLARRAFTVWIKVGASDAWRRVARSGRPLARAESAFRRLYADRAASYEHEADDAADDVEGVLLAALRIVSRRGALKRLEDYVSGPAAVVADEQVLGLHPPGLAAPVHRVPPGEAAKTLSVAERVWDELELDRGGTIVALGGGATTDLAGFVAATYLRGVPWIAAPTTLVAQVDAAIGGKTAINLAKGKNLAGAFHYPRRVVADPDVLRTLSEAEWRAGMAEVVKTGLLCGRELWREHATTMVRGCAAFKAAVCLSDPFEETGRRSILNLGHTFAHALEAASGYALSHGDAVALGLVGALRLSGLETDVVDDVLRPQPVRLDRERAWAALRRDKKARDGRIRVVLLERPGKPVFPVELPEREVRAALDPLIAD
jgi:shikimate kinase/3-dehydroquinate synthase